MTYKPDDITLLVPSFRELVEKLLKRLTELGYEPIMRDGYRTPAEAEKNATKGTGIADSMHCHRVAADLVCNKHGWDCAKHGCTFFDVLHAEALELRLTRVRKTTKDGKKYWDPPHVQAIPVRLQNKIRAMPEDRVDTFVRSYLAGLVRG